MGLQGHVISKPVSTAPSVPEVTTKAPEISKEVPLKSPPPAKSESKEAPKNQLKEVIQEAEKTEAPKDQLYEFDINGKKRLMTIEQMKREVQKGIAAEDKFREAATMRKEAQTILEYFKTNPAKAMKEMGHDVRQMAEEYLADEIRKEMMSPEQREAMDWKRRAEESESKLKEADTKAEAEQHQLKVQKIKQKYDVELTEALTASGLQSDPSIIKGVARIMHDYLQDGYEISAKDAVAEFQDSLLKQASTLIRLVGPEKATAMLGDDFMTSIRKEDLKKLKNPLTPSGDNGQYGTRAVSRKEKEEKISIEEWKRRTRERIQS